MKITLIHVLSLDAKLTKGLDGNIYEWSSKEDYLHFRNTINLHNLIIMGSGTFNAVHNNPQSGFKPEKDRRRIVLTSNPKKYKSHVIDGQLEFSNESPKQLIHRMARAGYTKAFLVSGGKLATSFFKEKLIDDLLITIEPRIFGKGEAFVQGEAMDISLKLLGIKQLNKTGTILLQYKVLK